MMRINSSIHSSIRAKYPLIVIGLFVLSSLTMDARSLLRPAVAKPALLSAQLTASSPTSFPSQDNSVDQALEAESITIRPTGFEPSEITRPKGRFILAVENRSGLDDVDLQLDREGGNRLHQVRVPRNKLDWSGVVDPPQGIYVLTEANHPDWSCRITITAR